MASDDDDELTASARESSLPLHQSPLPSAGAGGAGFGAGGAGERMYTPARVRVLLGCFVLMFTLTLQHLAFATTLRDLLSIKDKEMEFIKTEGYKVQAALFVGRAFSMLPTGALLLRSVRLNSYVYSGLASSALGLLIAPKCFTTDLSSSVFAMLLVGFGHGVLLVTMVALQARWVPRLEYSRAVALVAAAYLFAVLCSDSITDMIVQLLGWTYVYYCYAAVGLVLVLPAWWRWVRDSPFVAAAASTSSTTTTSASALVSLPSSSSSATGGTGSGSASDLSSIAIANASLSSHAASTASVTTSPISSIATAATSSGAMLLTRSELVYLSSNTIPALPLRTYNRVSERAHVLTIRQMFGFDSIRLM